MRIRLNDVRVSIENNAALEDLAAKKLGIRKENIDGVQVLRKAVDARRKTNIILVYHLLVDIKSMERNIKRLLQEKKIALWQEEKTPALVLGTKQIDGRPIVIGAGPAGLLAALKLAEKGYKPLLIERGKTVAQRVSDVNKFWHKGEFTAASNVQFGEGGAGTFSDGKLTTRVNDPLMSEILRLFVEAGAPQEILVEQKPHVGTDKLRLMVTGLTKKIKQLGGEVRYETQVVDFKMVGTQITGVVLADGEVIASNAIILACGHSARDTYELLVQRNIALEAKPFAIGVRIEHSQKLIDQAQYGEFAGNKKLGAADYALVYHDKLTGRSAYSFCMCPGGVVVAAASESGGVVTNGMSLHLRNSGLANSAVVVNVGPEDFGRSPLAGVEFQRQYEKLAFVAGGSNYKAPSQNVVSFIQQTTPSLDCDFTPSYKPGLTLCDLNKVLPTFVSSTLRAGLVEFGRKIKGFDQNGILVGIETRTSAPVRIVRDYESLQSVSHKGLYPAGEGAGYAGGIMSAALDGYHVAMALMSLFKPLA